MQKFESNYIILAIWLTSIGIGYACNCPIVKELAKIQNYEIENSECIFVGDVFEVDKVNKTFKVKVIESFDETGSETIYSGTYDPICGPSINEKGFWLIYANFYGGSELHINSCGLTRSFKRPEDNLVMDILMPSINDNQNNWRKEWNKKATMTLSNEMANLRKRRKSLLKN